MSQELRFTVEGRCVPWQRTATHNGRKLTPKAQREYQRRVRAVGSVAVRQRHWPMDARFAVELVVYEPDARRRDCDNELKTILDSLNGITWLDDSQVDVACVVRRIDRERPRVEVTVAPMTLVERDSARVEIVIGGAA